MQNKIYDIIGIGIGPFNLGLAAILQDLPELKTLFVDTRPSFDWHPGLLLPSARMQVPFYADLVSIVNPQSKFTYINYLKINQRFFKFANNDNIYPLRIEYNRYCQWVAAQLPSLCFSHHCEKIVFDEVDGLYTVETSKGNFHGKHIVLGTGTTPIIPKALLRLQSPQIIHSSDYLFHKKEILSCQNITVLGSGQSAAEIFRDLLDHADDFNSLSWFTRANRFHPMDTSKFTTEMTSLDYIEYFYSLSPTKKDNLLKEQQYLFKGINNQLISEINDVLYLRDVLKRRPTFIHTNCNLVDSFSKDHKLQINFSNSEEENFTHVSDFLISATGYEYKIPSCLSPIKSILLWDEQGRFHINRNYSIDNNNSVFVQNADLHTHGFNSADLGMGPYRNASILNAILNQEHIKMESSITFQAFGIWT